MVYIRFTSLLAINFKNTNYFTRLKSAFHWLFCMTFPFKLVTFSKSYARKQKWVFFSEHSVLCLLVWLLKSHILTTNNTGHDEHCAVERDNLSRSSFYF